MRNWLRRVMEGRHGPDQLGQVMLFGGLVISLFSGFRNFHWLILPSYVLLGLSLFRMLSRDHERRWKENETWLKLWGRLRGSFRGVADRTKQSREYHFYQCPKCGQRLRVPRGKGKLEITCPKCGEHFVKKT